jgi:flagellar hook-basal body complex protein FliE
MAIVPVGPSVWGLANETIRPSSVKPAESPFNNLIDRLLGQAAGHQAEADQAVEKLALGQTDSLHGVMLSVAKADLSFHMILEIRNRMTDAYQEIMRMSV